MTTKEQDLCESVSRTVENYLYGEDESMFIDEEEFPEFFENPPLFTYEVKVSLIK